MDKDDSQSSKKTKKNFMWTAKTDKFLVSFLAECAKNGEKHGKTFPKSVYTKAADAVSDFCKLLCTTDNVDSHMKTVKKKYSRIVTLRAKSGWGWDDDLKMIKVNKDDAVEFIEENPWAKEFLNAPIEQFEELRLVCGEDQATGSFSKSGSNAQTDERNEGSSAHDASSEDRRRGKRSRPWDDVMAKVDDLSHQVGKLTEALVDDSFVEKLYSEVLNMEGFDLGFLEKAFDYLVAHQLEGKKFMVRRLEMRKEWLQVFASKLD